MAMIPNMIPALLGFGLMGILGIALDTDTLLIAPLIIGIAVDDTIHFMTHYRVELIRTGSTLRLPLSPAIGVATQPIFLRISQAAEGPPTTRPAARWLPEERPMGGAGSGAHIRQVRPHEAAGSKPCVPRSPGGGAAAHGRGAAVRAGSAQRPAKPEGLLADAPWAIYPSVGLSLAVQQV